MSPVRRAGVACVTVALVVAAPLLGGCTGSSDSSSPAPVSPSAATDRSTELADLDTSSLAVARQPFCDAVDQAAVDRALGGEAADVSAYRSGQRIKISDDVADVVHEYGCRWTAGDSTAEAWVFAPPITQERATTLAHQIERSRGCRRLPGAADFGRPTAACSRHAGGAVVTSYAGLFGDAWLACSLTLSGVRATVAATRADRWCAAVATGAAS
jgi:hypothetical protein